MTQFIEICCGECGISFCVPSAFNEECRRKGRERSFYCPNGHSRAYMEGTEAVMRRERDRAIQEKARLEDLVREQREEIQKTEKEKQRLKRRVANGVCPCCNRSFANMAAHIRTKHPELTKEKVVTLKKGK